MKKIHILMNLANIKALINELPASALEHVDQMVTDRKQATAPAVTRHNVQYTQHFSRTQRRSSDNAFILEHVAK